MKNALVLLVLLWSCAIACTTPENKQDSTVIEEEQKEKTVEKSARPTPARYVGNVPVYQTFDEIAPLFEQQSDTTYVINFWATWCKPCVEELPYFEKLVKEYQGKKVQVILVSLDFEKQLESKLLPFLNEQNLNSELAVLADGKYNNWIDKVDPDWGGAIPATVIYNAKNRKFFGEQFVDFNELNELVKTLL